ncbi:VOC family protein [Desertihabitans brevis]|uniref:VOC family protein n=1 Tax=Desertihabitans brevis TaxID=2268447 RepID=A0A367YYF5_9ACTN|nr:VOC family protein [Desertihabitans brevis]RCK70943.1 VOC family protein [Desertihabitans brevis]
MHLENIVLDAVDPAALGRFWDAALGLEPLGDEPGGHESRLRVPGGPTLDLCLQRVPEPPSEPLRLHLDLAGGDDPEAVVRRLVDLGARPLDIGQGPDVPWTVLADPEGNPFCVIGPRTRHAGAGPLGEIPLDSADPEVDLRFWSALTGWQRWTGPGSEGEWLLRHPSGRGPLLSFCPEPAAKQGKNRMHLDVRLETGDDPVEVGARVLELGGSRFEHDWGELPWSCWRDPSGNELCLLPARSL